MRNPKETESTSPARFADLVKQAIVSEGLGGDSAYDAANQCLWIGSPGTGTPVSLTDAYFKFCAAEPSARSEIVSEVVRQMRGSRAGEWDKGATSAGMAEPAFAGEAKAEDLVGCRIGHIRVLSKIGEGGMGTVYLGMDETLDREVALKSLRPEFHLDQAARARFVREAQLLSKMNHPHICQIYDLVAERDHDFLVLERIKGKSLREALTDDLESADRLRIAIQLSEVLISAHQSGIVHRDLKPENVMLTPQGDIKVLDFGLGRSHEGEIQSTIFLSEGNRRPPTDSGSQAETKHGMVMGTLGYMSPEQARGEPTTPASDLYSLGLVLQELFTGERPFDRFLGASELLKRTSEGDTRPVEGLSGDLTGLIDELKQLSPERRPAAIEVARRLRLIQDKPKRRRRQALAIVAAVVVLGGAAKYTVDLRHERQRALAAEADALASRDTAEELLSFMLEDLYQSLEPSGRLDLLEQVAQRALEHYKPEPGKVLHESASRRRSTALRYSGNILSEQGNVESALEALGNARQISSSILEASPDDDEATLELARVENALARVQMMQDAQEEALASWARSEELLERLLERQPGHMEWLMSLSDVLDQRARALAVAGRVDEAVEVQRQAVSRLLVLTAARPQDMDLALNLADRQGSLGYMLAQQGDLDSAVQTLREALERARVVARARPANVAVQEAEASIASSLGQVLLAVGELDEATAQLERGIGLREALVVADPTNAHSKWMLSVSHDYLGEIYLSAGAPNKALESFDRALDLSRQVADLDPSNAMALNDLAWSYLQVGRAHDAKGDQRRARAAWRRGAEAAAPLADSDTELLLDTYARLLLYLGDVETARPVIERSRAAGFDYIQAEDFVELCRRNGLEEVVEDPADER